jgi:hypothetical protein
MFAVRGSRFAVRGSWFVVRGSWFVVRGSWFAVRGSWFVRHGFEQANGIELRTPTELEHLNTNEAVSTENAERLNV